MGISNTSGKNNYYVCNTYKKKGKDVCTIHYLLYDELYECVLKELQFMLKMVQSDSESFKKAVLAKLNVSGKKESVSINKEICELQKHIEKLDNRLGKIYDDRLDGVISTDEFRKFKEKFEAEKSAVSERLKQLQDKMTAQSDNISNVDLFTETIMSYLEIDSLDKEILNRLIDKIVVGDRVKIDGRYTQRIEIFYRYIGSVG